MGKKFLSPQFFPRSLPQRCARDLFVFLDNLRDFFAFDVTGEAHLAADAEGDLPCGNGEERVVATDAHVLSGFYFCATLADDDHARARGGAIGELHAEIFWI
jgi:hypothetical protein